MIITRFHGMERIEVEVEFLTPTFLGGADQQAELRSAPFKNLLRQWWRVANGNLDVGELRTREGELFGTVNNKAQSSLFRFKIKDSSISYYTKNELQFPKIGIYHPELKGNFVPLEVYLGMGPVFYNNEKKINEYKRSAIQAGSKLVIEMMFPVREISILQSLSLASLFGSIGSRCRNGWGSLDMILPFDIRVPKVMNFIDAMNDGKEYPHALARTEKGVLAWETGLKPDYITAWKELAEVYVKVRTTEFMKKFSNVIAKDIERKQFFAHESASPRHLLGYPLTHHKINDETWGEKISNFKKPKTTEGRLASPLRLIIKRKEGKYVGRILHLPYSVHMNYPGYQVKVWEHVHNTLDSIGTLKRMEL